MSIVTEPAAFRTVLGHYPTGVCAITATLPDGTHAAMIVGSFTSISLDPPLVGFFPDKRSASWAKIAQADGFCVNVLGDHQEGLCRTLASSDPNKFDGVVHRLSQHGAPILDGVLAWIDCAFHAVHEAGDHNIAIGEVRALDIEHPGMPLLFHKGNYGKIAALL